MKDVAQVVLTVFELRNDRGYFAPRINVGYDEEGGVSKWQIAMGGSRCYIAHSINESEGRESEASHFMASRVAGAMLISKCGLFTPIVRGRITLKSAPISFEWTAQLDMEFWSEEVERIHSAFSHEQFDGWLQTLCGHTFIRRAIDDLSFAMRHPTEAFIFVYRGFEWIEDGLKIDKSELATALRVSLKQLKELGKIANVETGVRHASRSGKKLVADAMTYGTWMCGLVDAINYARSKVEPGFTPMASRDVAELVKMSVSLSPYP